MMHNQIDTAKEEEVPSFVSPHQLLPANVIHDSFDSTLKSKRGKNNDANNLCARERDDTAGRPVRGKRKK
jgi:hypothetical protein